MGTLTATGIGSLKEAGRYGDGDGLYLVVSDSGARSWMVRVQKSGKRRDIGLGSAKKVSLALARKRAAEVRSQIEVGVDPVAERKKARGIPTFREAAIAVHEENGGAWRNAKHRAQWLSSLETYAFPALGDVPVHEVNGPAVRDVLVAIWLEKPETARRVRQRIGTVIDWAIGKGYRTASLPVKTISKSLPNNRTTPRHHAALPYGEVPAFLERLREKETVGRLALEAAILMAARSGEIRGAVWSEIDFDKALWAIPAERMKGGREHVVPLSQAALNVFEKAKALSTKRSDLVFPGVKRGRPLSDMTLTKVVRDMNVDCTPHGFRSSFRDWVSEETNFDGAVAEAALAHAVGNKVEAAYRRGTMLEKRRTMMDAWAAYCDGTSANVVSLVSVS